jgi:hypothetical protein
MSRMLFQLGEDALAGDVLALDPASGKLVRANDAVHANEMRTGEFPAVQPVVHAALPEGRIACGLDHGGLLSVPVYDVACITCTICLREAKKAS